MKPCDCQGFWVHRSSMSFCVCDVCMCVWCMYVCVMYVCVTWLTHKCDTYDIMIKWHRFVGLHVAACVAVCCSVLQCVAVWCSVRLLAQKSEWCHSNTYVRVSCQYIRTCDMMSYQYIRTCDTITKWHCVTVGVHGSISFNVSQCAAGCRSVLQCVAVCCSV